MFPGIEGVFVLRFDPLTLRLSVNGELESSEPLGGFIFDTAEPEKVVKIDTRTLPETACWGIRSSDLLAFESRSEEVSSQLPDLIMEKKTTIGTSEPLQTKIKPNTRGSLQDQAIIEILKNLNYDPKAIPPRPAGHSGAKSVARREALTKHKDLFTTNSFDKIWQRLRDNGEIVDLP